MSVRRSSPLASLFFLFAACGETPAPVSSAEPVASPTRASQGEVVVKLGYQKIGVPFLLKNRPDDLTASLAKHGARAEWVEFQAGPPLLEAMRAGAVDIGYVGETPPVFAQAGGVPFVYVAVDAPAPRAEAVLVPKTSPIQSVAELSTPCATSRLSRGMPNDPAAARTTRDRRRSDLRRRFTARRAALG